MTNPLGLGAEAKERRRGYVTASDAAKIMEGRWPEVYRLKRGLAEEDNLDDELRVQMGSMTEPFNLFWYTKQTGRSAEYYSDNPMMRAMWLTLADKLTHNEFFVSKEHSFMACSLDATSTTSKGHACVLDAKHVGQFRYDELVQRYLPGMTHQAVVVGVDHWALSVFVANNRWELIEQAVDVFYREELIEKEADFWGWVERGEEPPEMGEPAPPPKPQPRLRNVEMSMEVGSEAWKTFVLRNQWGVEVANAIEQFAETEGAHKAYEVARGIINKTLPDDIGQITRPTKHGLFSGKRTSAGALVMTLKKEEK